MFHKPIRLTTEMNHHSTFIYNTRFSPTAIRVGISNVNWQLTRDLAWRGKPKQLKHSSNGAFNYTIHNFDTLVQFKISSKLLE